MVLQSFGLLDVWISASSREPIRSTKRVPKKTSAAEGRASERSEFRRLKRILNCILQNKTAKPSCEVDLRGAGGNCGSPIMWCNVQR